MRRYCMLTTCNVCRVAASILVLFICEDEVRRRSGFLCGEISGQ